MLLPQTESTYSLPRQRSPLATSVPASLSVSPSDEPPSSFLYFLRIFPPQGLPIHCSVCLEHSSQFSHDRFFILQVQNFSPRQTFCTQLYTPIFFPPSIRYFFFPSWHFITKQASVFLFLVYLFPPSSNCKHHDHNVYIRIQHSRVRLCN